MIPDLSISIITTDNRDQAVECLRSVFASVRRISLEVFVVDNACSDGSAEVIPAEFSQVKLIRNRERLGFSTNNNQVLSLATGRYLMLLNDDTIVKGDAFDHMVAFMDQHPDAGAAGANLQNTDGSLQQACDYPPNPIYEALRPLSGWIRPFRYDASEPTEVGCVSGACMLVRRLTIEQVGLLDPSFDPLYSEDIDWCHRIRQAGWKVYHLPSATVVHHGSQTMGRAPLTRVEKLYMKKAFFFRKYYGNAGVRAFKAILLLSSIAKILGWMLIIPLRRQVAIGKMSTHRRILDLAAKL